MKLASIEIAGFRGVKQTLTIQCPSGSLCANMSETTAS